MEPIISIITVCYNSEHTIARTLQSVLDQNTDGYEYLIIDGGSEDNTISIVSDYENKFQGKMHWLSEKDNGWYDAMNKGVHKAKGKFIIFLNSDDYFEENAIKNTIEFIALNKITSKMIVYGDSTNIYKNSSGKTIYRLIIAPDTISLDDRALRDGMCGIRHQSMFVGTEVYKEIGDLNLKYRLHADWDFLIRCLKVKVPMYHIKKNISYYSMYGVSTKTNYLERHLLRKDNNLCRYIDIFYIKDRWGFKVLVKKVFGEKLWNDMLFIFHTLRNK